MRLKLIKLGFWLIFLVSVVFIGAQFKLDNINMLKEAFQSKLPEQNINTIQNIQNNSLEQALRNALVHQEFLLYYQPIFEPKGKTIIGMEALLRWKRGDKIIAPNQFIETAEQSFLIQPIGDFVIKTACKQNKQWQNAGLSKFPISVNLSLQQIKDPSFVARVADILQTTQLEPQFLEFEITESMPIENLEYTITVFNELKKLGVKLAMDDFGTGYSSFNHLRHLPVDKIKIDKSYIQAINNARDINLLTNMIALARNLNIQVVVEGVENKQQQDVLMNSKCDGIQGYLFSHPLPATEVTHFLNAHSLKTQKVGA